MSVDTSWFVILAYTIRIQQFFSSLVKVMGGWCPKFSMVDCRKVLLRGRMEWTVLGIAYMNFGREIFDSLGLAI